MAQLKVQSNLKCITSGNVPTTENLLDGEFAFGNVGGEPKLYGNVDGTIVDFSGDITIDADTLNGLLSGGNGIEIAKNTAGDKVEVKLSNSGFTIGDTAGTVNDQTITLNPNGENSGAYISVNYHGSMVYTLITPSGIQFVNPGGTTYALTSGDLKTVNGQSIYGSGDIDTTPTLKTVNSTSLTGDGNIYLKEFGVTDSNELNFKASASLTDLYVGYATMSETGAKQTGYTISNYKFMKGTGSTSAFADLYCAKLYTSSDERLKENIEPYEPTTSVLDLSIKEFNYKDSKVKSVGVIAQEVQKLFPDAVSADKKSGYLSVDDRSLMYMLMAEVKKLRDRVNELEGR